MRTVKGYLGSSAVYSPCRRYRYRLTRTLDGLGEGDVLFVGLNPSTATEDIDDPTIRRCVGFARRWGFSRYVMANLHAWRSTDPRGLRAPGVDPDGPDNARHVLAMAADARLIICAWGAHWLSPSAIALASVLVRDPKAHHLGLTKAGRPRHPLYLPKDVDPWSFRMTWPQ